MKSTTSHEDQFSPEPTPAEEEAWREMEKRQNGRSDAGSEPPAIKPVGMVLNERRGDYRVALVAPGMDPGAAVFAAPVAQPWQNLAAALYQAAGAYDMPVRVLDVLSAAANGEPFAHLIDGLLPVHAPVAQEPVAWLSCDPDTGKPVWSEACVCEDNVYSPDETGTVGRPVIFADTTPVAAQAQPETEERPCHETDGCPTELAVLQRFWREHQQPVSGADGLPDSPTRGMSLGQRIAHVGGRENAQGYVEFGSPMAVDALIQHILRDMTTSTQEGAFQARYRLPGGPWSSWGAVTCGVKGHEQELRYLATEAQPQLSGNAGDFEAWIIKHCDYDDLNESEVELAREAWKARAALAAQGSGQDRRVQTITMFGSDEITLRRGSGWDEHRVVWNVAARSAAKEQS